MRTTLSQILSPTRSPNDHDHLTSLIAAYGLFPHLIYIITNTLNSKLLLESLQALYWMVVYLYANKLLTEDIGVERQGVIRLVEWGSDKLEAEAMGMEMGINK